MLSTSDEYKEYLLSGNRNFLAEANVTLANGTTLKLDASNIMTGGISLIDSTSSSGSFDIGSAACGQCTIKVNNMYGDFDKYDFTGAKFILKVGLPLSKTIEWLNKGYYTIESPEIENFTIKLVGLDNMSKFDRPYTESKLVYPATTGAIIRDACTICGVAMGSATFTNATHVIQTRPVDDSLTFREMVAYVAQIAGCYARINNNGALEIKWYDTGVFENSIGADGGRFDKLGAEKYLSGDNADGGNFTDYAGGVKIDSGTFEDTKAYHHLFSLSSSKISTDDVVITGLKIVEYSDSQEDAIEATFGSAGYILTIADNPLVQKGAAESLSKSIGSKIVGMRFRPLTVSAISDPTIECGDCAYVSDQKGNSYPCYLTNLSYTINEYESYSCNAETPSRNNAAKYSEATKAIVAARNMVKSSADATKKYIDIATENLNNLINNSSGLYKTEEKQPDGSTIFYSHDKPTLKESQIIWKFTAAAIAVSSDGGKTYPYGMSVDGDTIVKILSATGVSADWMRVGTIEGGESKWDLENGGFDMCGNFSQKGSNGKKSVEIRNNQVNIFDWKFEGNQVGSVSAVYAEGMPFGALALACIDGNPLHIGAFKENDTGRKSLTAFMTFTSNEDGISGYQQLISVFKDMYFYSDSKFTRGIKITTQDDTEVGAFYPTSSGGSWVKTTGVGVFDSDGTQTGAFFNSGDSGAVLRANGIWLDGSKLMKTTIQVNGEPQKIVTWY